MNNLYALKITVTNFCGYKCRYCYVNTENKDVISEDLLYRVIDFYIKQKGKNKIIFFLGGEALLEQEILKKGIKYAYNKGKKLSKNITFFITTSGLSINRNIIKFFKKYNVKIGVSIDGNEKIHGINRISKTGLNTYSNTINAINLFNEYYDDTNLGYALTVDENTVDYLFESFLYLSNLYYKKRNITIAGVYKKGWREENLILLDNNIKKICSYIIKNINKKDFYYYNVLSFFILEILKGNYLNKGNTEIHVFPDGVISLSLFKQSVLGEITNDPTKGRFDYVNKFALKIIKKSKTDKNYLEYINSLYKKAIL